MIATTLEDDEQLRAVLKDAGQFKCKAGKISQPRRLREPVMRITKAVQRVAEERYVTLRRCSTAARAVERRVERTTSAGFIKHFG